jgi:cytochrome d ubiquinol oxidase subunit II
MFDYATLRVIWWALLGTLFIGFAVMDGFDFGVAGLLKVLGRNNEERSVLIEGIEATWEGNQVWFVLAGGATFAAWPMLYAVSFSGMYLAIFLVLLGFILRPVGFNFRGKVHDPRWVSLWDWVLVASGVVVMLISGVAFGNLFRRRPAHDVAGWPARSAASVRPAGRAGVVEHAAGPRRLLGGAESR